LNSQLKSKLNEHETLGKDLKNRIETAELIHKAIFDEYFKNKSRLEYMKSHTIEMNNKMIEMTENKAIMLKQIEKFNNEIESLE
jgi:hypothetical protein